MAGLLGNYAPGLLGGMQDQMPPVPFRQNPVVSAIGAGLLQGPNMAGRYDFSAVGPAIATKGLMQQKAADRQAAEARRLAMNEVIKNYSGLSPEDRAFYMANPDKFDPASLKSKKADLIASDKPIYDPSTNEWITPPQPAGGGALEGTGLDNQFWNIALEANRTGRFDTPEYAAAYSHLTEPRTRWVMTENGMVPVTETPQVPAWLKPPPGMGASVAGAGGGGGGVSVPAGAGAPGEAVPGSRLDTEFIRTDKTKAQQAYNALDEELTRYTELVGKHGIEAMPGPVKDNLVAVRQGIMLQLKELFNLGVLNGPDLALMERMIYDPTVDVTKEGGLSSLPDQIITSTLGSVGLASNAGERAANSAAELRRMLANIAKSKGVNIGGGGSPTADDPLGIR